MTLGAEELSRKFGGPLGVAEALLKGEIGSYDQLFVGEAIGSRLILEAARIRIEWRREEQARGQAKQELDGRAVVEARRGRPSHARTGSRTRKDKA